MFLSPLPDYRDSFTFFSITESFFIFSANLAIDCVNDTGCNFRYVIAIVCPLELSPTLPKTLPLSSQKQLRNRWYVPVCEYVKYLMVRRLNEWYHAYSWHISLYSSFRTFSRFEQGVILSSDDLVKSFLCFLPYYGLTHAFNVVMNCESSPHTGAIS